MLAAVAVAADGGEQAGDLGGPATTRRSTVWATAGAFHPIRSTGLASSSRSSTA